MSHLQNMRVSSGTSEITESTDELILAHHPKCLKLANIKTKMDETVRKKPNCPVEDDLNRLLEAFDLRSSSRASGPSRSVSVDLLRKSAMKKPVRIGLSQASGIGISESVTLKQALRRLCITQASEMAATKRISKPVGLSGASEAGAIKRLYAAVVVEASESGKGGKGNLLEISLVPEKSASMSSEKITESSKIHSEECLNKTAPSTSNVPVAAPEKPVKTKVRDIISPASPKVSRKPSPGPESGAKGKLKSESSVSSTNTCNNPSKLSVSPHLTKPAFKNYSFPKKKGKGESTCTSGSCGACHEPNTDSVVSSKNKPSHKKSVVTSGSNNAASLPKEDSGATKPDFSPGNHSDGRDIGKTRKEILRSKDKGECSQSSKSSIGDYSSSTSISDESNQSNCSVIGSRPHMSNDVRWAAIHDVEMQYGNIGLKNFKLLKRLGCGDIGSVYLAELTGSECMFALKVMDNEFLINRKKMMRAQTEREILQMLDHPFLPTLYTFFTTDNLSCLVMEYCPGGDLHVLRQKQQGRNFSEPAARFYVAEVLLALEYLHMLGVVYRDLKPENILVREDGHIMLSDFDLSLRCSVNPMLLRPSSVGAVEAPRPSGACAGSSCIDPLCLHPSWVQTSCFTPRLLSSAAAKNRRPKWDGSAQIRSLPQLVVEPTEARSNSFVGTHEYLAPEIIKGEGHGSSVDWWTFGIFLYELLYGRTPFKGPTNEDTLANVISQSLKFPDNPAVSFRARDLIRGLLVKEPEKRLGSVRGAAEIKRHPFFEGLNWALIRCAAPPETPKPCDFGTPAILVPKQKENKCTELRDNEDDGEFEIF